MLLNESVGKFKFSPIVQEPGCGPRVTQRKLPLQQRQGPNWRISKTASWWKYLKKVSFFRGRNIGDLSLDGTSLHGIGSVRIQTICGTPTPYCQWSNNFCLSIYLSQCYWSFNGVYTLNNVRTPCANTIWDFLAGGPWSCATSSSSRRFVLICERHLQWRWLQCDPTS